jgi:hypothetical protein
MASKSSHRLAVAALLGAFFMPGLLSGKETLLVLEASKDVAKVHHYSAQVQTKARTALLAQNSFGQVARRGVGRKRFSRSKCLSSAEGLSCNHAVARGILHKDRVGLSSV